VAVKGQDVAFKDVIEPLESVSVSIIKTDKDSLQDLGSADQVAKALVERVLASPTQKTQLIEAKEVGGVSMHSLADFC
jgi:photosystem II oxygen-evolving enhancer protein 2